MSATFGAAGPPLKDALGAVDPLDAAARIEASGRGDVAARSLGYDDVFSQALEQFSTPAALPEREESKGHPRPAVERALFMVSGVVLCVQTVVADAASLGLVVAGVACWFAAQMVSTILWWGEGVGQSRRAWPLAFLSGVGLLVVAGVLSVVTSSVAIVVWTAWGCTAAVVSWRWAGSVAALACAGAAGVSGLAILTAGPQAGAMVATAFILLPSAGLVILALRVIDRTQLTWRALASWDGPGPGWLVGQAVLRVTAQVATVVVLWRMWPDSFLLVAVGAITAGAVGEIVVELAANKIRRLADRLTRWQEARRQAVFVGGVGLLTLVVISLAVVWVAAQWLALTIPALLLLLIVLNTGVGMAVACELRIGLAERATAVAFLGLILVSLIAALHTAPMVPSIMVFGMAVVGVFLVAAWAAQSLAGPQAW